MLIRKLFKFENSHIVRNCTTQKCRTSIHGHSYKAEILLESNFLDHGQMVYDFALIKHWMGDIIDAFDHSISLWSGDDEAYIAQMKAFSARWVEIPVNPSAEQLSRIFFVLIDKLLKQTNMINKEKNVSLYSVIVHETDTGYAQCFRDDAYNKNMGEICLDAISFSEAVRLSWKDKALFDKLKNNETVFTNPDTI